VDDKAHFVTVKVEPQGGNVYKVTEMRTDDGHVGELRVTMPTIMPPPSIAFPKVKLPAVL